MRSIAGALALMVVASATASAQDFEAKYKDKLKKEFVSKVGWVQNLEKAQEAAAAQNKLIFGYFTRSYAP
jgi:malonyl CoA-acyl carrier protein transacylase